MDDVKWRIVIDGFPTRDSARKIASLLRRAAKDNLPDELEEIRIEVHGYTMPETQE